MDLAQSIGLLPFTERDAAGNPLLEEDETLLNKFERLQLVLGADSDQGEGTLCVTPSRIIWLSNQDASKGYAVDFTAISMHAVMTDPESAAKPCLYIQLDQDEEADYGGREAEDDEEILPELRLVPASSSELSEVFQAFCDGAVRNPDADAEEEGDGELFCDEDEVLAGAADAGIHFNDVDEIVQGDLDRFGDADDANGDEDYDKEDSVEPPS